MWLIMMAEDSELEISGHSDEWVALTDNIVVASESSFPALIKKLESKKLLNKVTVTHVSGAHVVL